MLKFNLKEMENLRWSVLDTHFHIGLNSIASFTEECLIYAFNNSAVVFPVLEKLTEMQEKTGRKMLVVVHAAGDSVNNTPKAVADTAQHFPKILFIMAHF